MTFHTGTDGHHVLRLVENGVWSADKGAEVIRALLRDERVELPPVVVSDVYCGDDTRMTHPFDQLLAWRAAGPRRDVSLFSDNSRKRWTCRLWTDVTSMRVGIGRTHTAAILDALRGAGMEVPRTNPVQPESEAVMEAPAE